MELNFITGRAGSGKSQYCIGKIAELCNESPENKVFLIVPEQFSIQAERRMLEKIVSGGVIDNEVLSFKRLVYRVLDIYGGVDKKVLNISGRSMILARAFRICESKLSYYKNFTETPWNVEKMMSLVTEFIRYGVEEDVVFSLAEELSETDGKAELGVKLKELATVYSKYRELLNVEYMDELHMHRVLMEKMEKEKPFKDAVVWIDEFTGFTTLEMEIIESLIKQCKSVNICMLNDKKQKSLFKGTSGTLEMLRKRAELLGCPVSESALPKDNLPRFKENPALAFLEKEFGNYPYSTFETEPENIEIFSCNDIHQEVYNSAVLIRKLCREEKLQFKDITVTVRDLDRYKNVIAAIYPLMGITYFMDDKMSLDKHPVTSCIMDALDIVAENWRFDSVFSFLKSGFFTDDTDAVNRLENEVLRRGIRGKSSWSKPLSDPECEELRKKFMLSMNILYEGLRNCGNYNNGLKALCAFLDTLNIKMPDSENKEEVIKISKMITEVFKQLCDFLGGEKCGGIASTARELKFLLKNGFSKYMVGFIPEFPDSVHIGEADRSRTNDIKALLVLGANEGVFPKEFTDDGILSDEDRDILQKKGIALSEDMRARAFLEQFLIYRTITTPQKYLYISFSLKADGESSKASWLVRRVKNILPKVRYTQCEEKVRFSPVKLTGSGPFTEGAYLSPELAEKLFTKNGEMYLSVSAMEKYNSCPYRFFMDNGIKAKLREEFSVENTDVGILLHALLELGTKAVLSRKDKDILTEDQCAEIIKSVTDEALGKVNNEAMVATAGRRFALGKLQKFATKALCAVAKQCSSGAYVPGGFEVEFGEKRYGSLPPLEFVTPSGDVIKIRGKIDRYDYWDHEGVRYYRVIDYKSYAEDITPSEVGAGSKMQLVTYADVLNNIAEKEGLESRCGGVFYQDISSSRTKGGDYKLKGMFYDMDENIQAMVGDGNGGLSKKALDPDSTPGRCVRVPEGGFELLKNKTEENIQRISQSIKSGQIPVKPISYGENPPCKYCDFKNICGFCGQVKKWQPESSDEFFNKYLKNRED